MKDFFMKNKVLIIGLLSAILLAISEIVKGNDASIKMLIFSAVVAGLSFLAKNLRGQAASIAGLIASALTAYLTQQETGHVSWAQIVTQTLIALLGIWASPAKSVGYEKTDIIVEAKKSGEEIQPTAIVPKP